MNNHIHMNKRRINHYKPPARERGLAMVIFTIGMLVVLVVAGLALDVSHAMLNKTRLQNVVDLMALAAADELNQSGSTADAQAAAERVFLKNEGVLGHARLAEDLSMTDVIIEYSANLEPTFDTTSTPERFVRVRVETFDMPAWLIQLIGITQKNVRASAISGPSVPLDIDACGLVPLIVCADMTEPPGTTYGYTKNEVTILKSGSQSDYDSGKIGNGNFQLARVNSPGANALRDNLAGGIEDCSILGPTIDTEPGNTVGPTDQGLNTRMNEFEGSMKKSDYPSDVILQTPSPLLSYDYDNDRIMSGTDPATRVPLTDPDTQLTFDFEEYADIRDNAARQGEWDLSEGPRATTNRRILPVVMANCEGASYNGTSSLPVVTLGCFFMLQPVTPGDPGKGNEAEIYGQFVEECRGKGTVSQDGPNDGPVEIVLYNDIDSWDS